MNPEVLLQLSDLAEWFQVELNRIHDEAIRNFDRLARSTGQRTRIDRATK